MFGLFNQYIINFISFNSKKTHMKWTAPQGLDTCVRIDGSLT
jgi:hypothetical protein